MVFQKTGRTIPTIGGKCKIFDCMLFLIFKSICGDSQVILPSPLCEWFQNFRVGGRGYQPLAYWEEMDSSLWPSTHLSNLLAGPKASYHHLWVFGCEVTSPQDSDDSYKIKCLRAQPNKPTKNHQLNHNQDTFSLRTIATDFSHNFHDSPTACSTSKKKKNENEQPSSVVFTMNCF